MFWAIEILKQNKTKPNIVFMCSNPPGNDAKQCASVCWALWPKPQSRTETSQQPSPARSTWERKGEGYHGMAEVAAQPWNPKGAAPLKSRKRRDESIGSEVNNGGGLTASALPESVSMGSGQRERLSSGARQRDRTTSERAFWNRSSGHNAGKRVTGRQGSRHRKMCIAAIGSGQIISHGQIMVD